MTAQEEFVSSLMQLRNVLFAETGVLQMPYLYLTQEQYDLSPELWKRCLRQHNVPETNIIIIPGVKEV